MARARNIKPGFFKNEDLIELPFEYRLLFAGLWTLADREGRLEDRPKRIKIELFPSDDVNVDHGLDELARYGFVERYEANDIKVVTIPKFSEHQAPHAHEKASVLPDKHGICAGSKRGAGGGNMRSGGKSKGKEPSGNGKSTIQVSDEQPTNLEKAGASTGQVPDRHHTSLEMAGAGTGNVGAKKVQTPDKAGAGTVHVPTCTDMPCASTAHVPTCTDMSGHYAECRPDSLNPSSLIPDSLNPESLMGRDVRTNCAKRTEPESAAMPEPVPAPLAQATSLFDGWIFAPDPAEPEPEPVYEPEPSGVPDPMPTPLVQGWPADDEPLLPEPRFALTPDDEAEVDHILFGTPLPASANKKRPPDTSADAGDKAKSRAERATRIPKDWTLSEKNRRWVEENHPNIDIDLEAQKFHNHFLSVGGKDGRRVDWDATWRKWALNAWPKRQPNNGYRQPYNGQASSSRPYEILAI